MTGEDLPGPARPVWLRPFVRLARYTCAHAVLVVTALVGGLLALGLTAVSAQVYDAVSDTASPDWTNRH